MEDFIKEIKKEKDTSVSRERLDSYHSSDTDISSASEFNLDAVMPEYAPRIILGGKPMSELPFGHGIFSARKLF